MSVFRSGATALISGGASGVGFALAQVCRKHGMHLALLDINKSNLSKAASALPSTDSAKTETYEIDVSDFTAWQSLVPKITSAFPSGIDLLVLNAGAGFQPDSGKTQWTDPSVFHKTYGVNVFGYVNGLAAFLPVVQQSKQPAAIVLTGSKQGITNPPGNPSYNSSKSAVKTIAEHLAHDLRSSNPNISVHLLIPGWAYTGLSGNAGPVPDEEASKSKKPGAWLPSQVASYAEKLIEDKKFYIVCPDNDVDEALDQARMTWQMQDVTENRGALSRWDDKYKEDAADWIKKEAERRRK